MTKEQKKAVLANFVAGKTPEEIAESLAVPIADVRTALKIKPADVAPAPLDNLAKRARALMVLDRTPDQIADELQLTLPQVWDLQRAIGLGALTRMPGPAPATTRGPWTIYSAGGCASLKVGGGRIIRG